ncbi:MAG: 16S rRNA methyltransferase [Acidobacteria bacterium]|nr:MAG: 16S rRNA methyltransferase [Acidobacteriota bacterium]
MTRRRWIADEFSNDHASLLGQNAAHLARVLRARVGQEFDIVCGETVRVGSIASVSDERVEFSLGEAVSEASEREIVLVAAIYKFDRMEWAIEKCTELGVTRIIPVIARRTDSHLATAAAKRVERWRRIVHEAAQQSRRLRSPQIDEAVKLKSALMLDAPTRLLLNENERSENLCEALTEASAPIAIAVGPEGGWTEEELTQFAGAGWRSITLGSQILRAETAAIAALAVVSAILD